MADTSAHPLPLDFNCDLGEWEPPERTAALMALVDSANIACGGHAGNDASMRRCLELTLAHRVRPGAHPGWPTNDGFGRGPLATPSAADLTRLLHEQVGRLHQIAQALGTRLHHVKLHGSLYHAVDASPDLAFTYLDVVGRTWPGLVVYARAGGGVVAAAQSQRPHPLPGSVEVWPEAFLDRAIRDDGTLVPRDEPGAVLVDPAAILERLQELEAHGGWRSVTGRRVHLSPRTLCTHADSEAAVASLRRIRAARNPNPA